MMWVSIEEGANVFGISLISLFGHERDQGELLILELTEAFLHEDENV